MKLLIILILSSCICFSGFAQKPVLDTASIKKWPSVRDGLISNDGKYVQYIIENDRNLSKTSVEKLVFQSAHGVWKNVYVEATNPTFSEFSKKAFFLSKEGLCILQLGDTVRETIPDVKSYQIISEGKNEWIVYSIENLDKGLIFENVSSGFKKRFKNVVGYAIGGNAKSLVLKVDSSDIHGHSIFLKWIDLSNFSEEVIWTGNADNFVFDGSGDKLAFKAINPSSGSGENSIYYYDHKIDKTIELVKADVPGLKDNFKIVDILAFTGDDRKLIFNVKKTNLNQINTNLSSVDVWSYADKTLQSQQLIQAADHETKKFIMIAELLGKSNAIKLQDDDERLLTRDFSQDYIIFDKQVDSWIFEENPWNKTSKLSYEILSLKSCSKKPFGSGLRIEDYSPDGKYIVLSSSNPEGDVFTYEIASGITRNVTKKLPIPLLDHDIFSGDQPDNQLCRQLSFAGYCQNDSSIIVYDHYDIWKINAFGKRPSVCITNSYGRAHKIVFRFAEKFFDQIIPSNRQNLIVSAFDEKNKENGFYQVHLKQQSNPQKFFMGNYKFYAPTKGSGGNAIIKARDSDVFLVTRESAQHAPNYFCTEDFKKFEAVSNIHPENEFNWMTTELLNFKALNGQTTNGVLYKPEDFDGKRKYPVILFYYELNSDDLNHFKPITENGNLSVPWFVSHGYLVFVPDIHYSIGRVGESAFNSIVGAAKFIAHFRWVDSKKIGLQGHSFGGYETNYLITHSNYFAAAISSSGMSDVISYVAEPWNFGASHYQWTEFGQGRFGSNLWERPDLYIKNSPIFYADKVNTPVLLISNKQDRNVPFMQGVEFFTALRRLGKPVWMLQYDHGSHGVYGIDRMDYIMRSTQFFDFYLKGAAAPKWMVEGLPASQKGSDDGMELEPPGVKPGPGLLTPEAQRKVDAIKKRKPITVTFN